VPPVAIVMPCRCVARHLRFAPSSCRSSPSSCRLSPCCPLSCRPLLQLCRQSPSSCRPSVCCPLMSSSRPSSCYTSPSSCRASASSCCVIVPTVAVVVSPVTLLPCCPCRHRAAHCRSAPCCRCAARRLVARRRHRAARCRRRVASSYRPSLSLCCPSPC